MERNGRTVLVFVAKYISQDGLISRKGSGIIEMIGPRAESWGTLEIFFKSCFSNDSPL